MESFSADWLALREPADHAARPDELCAQLAARLGRKTSRVAVDLASGTGSNVRYLLPRLTHITHWILVDHDDALLRRALESLAPLADAHPVSIEPLQLDLADLDRVPLEDCALVTASALLDLVSRDWIDRLVARCRRAGADVLFALTYDGAIVCDPPDVDDDLVRDLVNRHQRLDKGFGPALGPDACDAMESALRGWEVVVASSPWRLTPDDGELQRQLVEGWAGAARGIAPDHAREIEAWRARRVQHIAASGSSMLVGHRDLAAWNRPGDTEAARRRGRS